MIGRLVHLFAPCERTMHLTPMPSPCQHVPDDVGIADLVSVHDGDHGLLERQRGYAISSQSQAPDLVLVVASATAGRVDFTSKREDCEHYGVSEYWSFDSSGDNYHDAALAELGWWTGDMGR